MIKLCRVLKAQLPQIKPKLAANMISIKQQQRNPMLEMLEFAAAQNSKPIANYINQRDSMQTQEAPKARLPLPRMKAAALSYTQKLLLPLSLSQSIQYSVISTKEFHEQKKNLTKVKAFLKEFVLLMKEGTKDTWRDGKWYFNLRKRKQRSQMTGFEVRQSLRIGSDLIKIVPFSFFLIVPMAELFLPLYLFLFPNAMPSQYTFDYAYDQYIQSLEDNQAAAHEYLVPMLKQHLMENCNASIDHFLHSDTYKQVFFKNFRTFEEGEKTLDFTKMSSDDLIQVCKFLGMEVITGTNIISKVTNLAINTPIWLTNLARSAMKKDKFEYSKFQLKMNFGPFEFLKRNLILSQIKRHISLLRLQDQAFFKLGFHDIVGYRITDFARERGITTITCYETLKAILANEWVNVCMNRKFNDNAMLWYSIMQYDFLRNANNDMN